MLETAPSFSVYSNNPDDKPSKQPQNELVNEKETNLERSVTIGDQIEGQSFSFTNDHKQKLHANDENDDDQVLLSGLDNVKLSSINEGLDLDMDMVPPPSSPPMYLAAGLGVGGEVFREERESNEVEDYLELLLEHPNHPVVLANYANFLKRNGDLLGAEEYYFRATQADPGDGEIMSQYAELVWEIHHDQEKALMYFEHAAQIAPEDSNVLAAYAKFLWEIDDSGDNAYDHGQSEDVQMSTRKASHHSDASDLGGSGPNEDTDIEQHYRTMIEENPSDPLFLKEYAQFLHQSKGDTQAAEEFYSRAVEADPKDGEMLSEYAGIIWELHRDQRKAISYYKRAVHAAPEDSDILAAYARFLWSIDDDDEDDDDDDNDAISS